eukprot:PhF_6_TR41336/c2_g1_i1/m.62707
MLPHRLPLTHRTHTPWRTWDQSEGTLHITLPTTPCNSNTLTITKGTTSRRITNNISTTRLIRWVMLHITTWPQPLPTTTTPTVWAWGVQHPQVTTHQPWEWVLLLPIPRTYRTHIPRTLNTR